MHPRSRYRLKQVYGALRPTSKKTMRSVAANLKRNGFSPRSIIDVGVADGTYEIYLAWPEARLHLVEAMTEFETRIREIVRSHPGGGTCTIAAAGMTDGSVSMGYSDDLHISSSVFKMPRTRDVPSVRLDSLVERHQIEGPVLLKVDVQGAEREVLAGAPDLLGLCDVVLLETQLIDFASNGHCVAEVIAFMDQAGFAPYDFYDGIARPADGALGQIDVAFVKKESRFRNPPVWWRGWHGASC